MYAIQKMLVYIKTLKQNNNIIYTKNEEIFMGEYNTLTQQQN